jgi:DNA-binding transcriptional ArsR family regulator
MGGAKLGAHPKGAQQTYAARLRPGTLSIIYNHMVVYSPTQAQTDTVFHALADATRRDIVKRTMLGPHSVSSLARRYPMSFAAVQKHVAVLERAGLITKEPRGRERLVRSDIDRIQVAARVLDELEAVWRARVDRMDEILAEPDANPPSVGADPCP